MKRIITILTIVLGIMINTQAQTVIKPTDKVLKDTTIKSIVYKLYVGSKGGKYIIVTSKAGNQYKKYFKK